MLRIWKKEIFTFSSPYYFTIHSLKYITIASNHPVYHTIESTHVNTELFLISSQLLTQHCVSSRCGLGHVDNFIFIHIAMKLLITYFGGKQESWKFLPINAGNFRYWQQLPKGRFVVHTGLYMEHTLNTLCKYSLKYLNIERVVQSLAFIHWRQPISSCGSFCLIHEDINTLKPKRERREKVVG
jgi:hypothetical protein